MNEQSGRTASEEKWENKWKEGLKWVERCNKAQKQEEKCGCKERYCCKEKPLLLRTKWD